MQIATSDAQVIPNLQQEGIIPTNGSLLNPQARTDRRGRLATSAKAPNGSCQHCGTGPAIIGEIHRASISYEVQFGGGIQEITDSRGILHAHLIQRAHTCEESCPVRRTTCCKFVQCIGGVEQRHTVPAISAKTALKNRFFNFAFPHLITLPCKVKTEDWVHAWDCCAGGIQVRIGRRLRAAGDRLGFVAHSRCAACCAGTLRLRHSRLDLRPSHASRSPTGRLELNRSGRLISGVSRDPGKQCWLRGTPPIQASPRCR